MSRMNGGRILVGGLAAGVVMNVIDAVANGVLLGDRWKVESDALDPTLMTRAATSSTVGWIVVDFLLGILIVWLYAAIRPRFGAGPTTAARAGLATWLIAHLAYFSYIFMGFYSAGLIIASAGAGLVAAMAGAYVGGKLYQEGARV
ncbi:MAG TPA: hypothetical protein VJ847_03480 [Gemmatimonadales bacterium]|nr:hypothetical protein [Gemmatimonadales bacterium]